MLTFQAAVLRQMGLPRPYVQSQPLQIEAVELAPPGAREVLVRIRAVGLCHSDLSTINGDRPRPLPMVLGHEAAGEVVECGPGVTDLAEGDRVVLVFAPSCGECVPCKEGRPGHCEPGQRANGAGTLLGGARRLRLEGQPLYHHLGTSAFAEYAVVHRGSLVRIDDALSFEEAALFGCAVLTGVGAALNTARVFPGARVAVVGLGGVGLNALLGARVAGASQIIALDTLEDKLHLARQLGATQTVHAADPDAAAAVRDLTGGGADFAFEMAGSVQALDLAYRITRRGGTTVTAGLPHPEALWALPPVQLSAEERTIKGSYMGSCVPLRDIPRYIDLYRRGQLPVDRLLSARISLEQINEGFDRLASGQAIRQIVAMG